LGGGPLAAGRPGLVASQAGDGPPRRGRDPPTDRSDPARRSRPRLAALARRPGRRSHLLPGPALARPFPRVWLTGGGRGARAPMTATRHLKRAIVVAGTVRFPRCPSADDDGAGRR